MAELKKEQPCLSDMLREIMVLNLGNPRELAKLIKESPSCYKKPTGRTRKQPDCRVQMENVQDKIDEARTLIKEGAPPRLYTILSDIIISMNKCSTPEIAAMARGLVDDIRVVTAGPGQNLKEEDQYYLKGEGVLLNKRLSALDRLIETSHIAEHITPTSGWAAPIIEETQANIEARQEELARKIKGD